MGLAAADEAATLESGQTGAKAQTDGKVVVTVLLGLLGGSVERVGVLVTDLGRTRPARATPTRARVRAETYADHDRHGHHDHTQRHRPPRAEHPAEPVARREEQMIEHEAPHGADHVVEPMSEIVEEVVDRRMTGTGC